MKQFVLAAACLMSTYAIANSDSGSPFRNTEPFGDEIISDYTDPIKSEAYSNQLAAIQSRVAALGEAAEPNAKLAIYRELIEYIVTFDGHRQVDRTLRYPVNQAISVTFGIPTTDGKGISHPGLNLRPDLQALILKNRIAVALKMTRSLGDSPSYEARLAYELAAVARTELDIAVQRTEKDSPLHLTLVAEFAFQSVSFALTAINSRYCYQRQIYANGIVRGHEDYTAAKKQLQTCLKDRTRSSDSCHLTAIHQITNTLNEMTSSWAANGILEREPLVGDSTL